MTKVAKVLFVAGCAGALLAGCASDSPGTAGGAPAPTTVGTQMDPGSGASGSGAGVEDRSADAIVEQTVAMPGAPDDETTVGIQSLTVENDTMVLRLVVTPDFASASDGEVVALGDAMDVGSEFFGVSLRLIDRENLKEYSVIHETTDWWASAATEVEATNGEPMYAFAVLAAPEDDIDTIDVRISEQWPEFTDVPIVR